MSTVTLAGITFDSDDLVAYGYLDPIIGLFAILTAMVVHLSTATAVQGVAATTEGAVLKVVGGVWAEGEASTPDDAGTVIANQVFS